MKRIIVVMAAALLLGILLPHSAWAFGVKDVVAMSREGVPDSLIVAKIRHSDATFHLGAGDLRTLREAGVSNDVVLAMLRTEDRSHPVGYYGGYYGDYYWPYDPPWYLGLDFDFYTPYHPYHRFGAPVYFGRGFGYRGYGGTGGYHRR